MSLENLFGNIGKTLPSLGGNYLNSGHVYSVDIESVRVQPSQKHGGYNIITEFKVIASSDATRQPGTTASWVLSSQHVNHESNFASLLAAWKGISVTDPSFASLISPAVAREACSDAQPIRGLRLRVETLGVPTKKGGTYTKHVWSRSDNAAPAIAAPVAPPLPEVPAALVPPLPAASFPPSGWKVHPQSDGFYYKGSEVLSEAKLRELS